MQEAYYNNGNTDEPAKFYILSSDDCERPAQNDYIAYLYNVTKINTFIKGLFKYTLYEDDWNQVDNSKAITINNTNLPNFEYSKLNLFNFFMEQLGFSLEAEQKVRDSFQWSDPHQKTMVLASIRDIVLPDYNNWKRQQSEHK